MAIVTYSSPDYGFGVTYDDARIVHTDDPAARGGSFRALIG